MKPPNTAPFRDPFGPRDAADRAPTHPELETKAPGEVHNNQLPPGHQLCRHCRTPLPLEEFGGLRTMADGTRRTQPWCIDCRFKYSSMDRFAPHPNQMRLRLPEQLRLKFPRRRASRKRSNLTKGEAMNGTLHQLPLPKTMSRKERNRENTESRRRCVMRILQENVDSWLNQHATDASLTASARRDLGKVFARGFRDVDGKYITLTNMETVLGRAVNYPDTVSETVKRYIHSSAVKYHRRCWLECRHDQGGSQRDSFIDGFGFL